MTAVPAEVGVLYKERSAGTYRLSAYFIAKTFAEVPIELVLPFVFCVIVYWMVGLSTDFYCFLLFLLLIFLFVLLSNSLGLLIGAAIANMKEGLTFSIICVMGSTLLGGFFISRENFPVFIRWARWTSFVKYGNAPPYGCISLLY